MITKTKPERSIERQHEIDFPGETTLSTEWIGEVVHCDEDAALYIHKTDVASYRYILSLESGDVLDSEMDWS
ncbi:hypothetical protein C0431_12580 [bacterium]|nr:hypothetical protein [bacterium]